VLVCSSTGGNTAALGQVDQVRVGLPELAFCGSTTVYADCIKISKTYVGPEEVPQIQYKLVISVSGNGRTDPSVGTHLYNAGSVVQVDAIPDSGYMLYYWLLDNVNVGSADPYNVAMDANHTLTAVFVEAPPAIFADGFDSGSFSQWTGSSVTSGETATAVNTQFHHGPYSAKFTTNGGGGTERAYVYKDIEAQSEVYVRGYFYIENGLPLQDNDDRFNLFAFMSGSSTIASLSVRRYSGADIWSITSNWGTWYASTGPITGQWCCIEFYAKIASTGGTFRMWVNGQLVIERTGLNTASLGNVNSVRAGLVYVYSVTQPVSVYADCLVISNTYIGPE
jgi:hypothetical protein